MTDEERKAWLAGLKVGDAVAIEFMGMETNRPMFGQVSSITKHRIKVFSECINGDFDPFACQTGHQPDNHNCFIRPVSASEQENIDRETLHSLIDADIPIATVRAILALLAEAEKEGKENQ